MKKSKALPEQPVGIVIATGSIAPSTPRVKAYFWFEEAQCSTETPVANRKED
jgi:hypothetical protein